MLFRSGISGTVSVVPYPQNVYTSGLQGVSGSVSITGPVTTLPVPTNVYTSGLQGISGSVGVAGNVAAVIQNWPAIIGVSGTVSTTAPGGQSVYTQGAQAVSGGVNITNWPQVIGVSGSVNVSPFAQNVYTQGPQAVSGAVNISNWPQVIGVTGSFNSGGQNVYTSGLQGISGTIQIGPDMVVVHSSATLTTGGSALISGIGRKEATLGVSINGAVTGATPTLTYTLAEVDPVNGTTLMTLPGNSVTLGPFNGTGQTNYTQVISYTGAMLLTWTVTGTFAGVDSWVTSKDQSLTFGLNAAYQTLPVSVIAMDANSNAQVVGPTAAGSTATTNPVLMAGVDSTGTIRTVKVDPLGRLDNQAPTGTVTNVNAAIATTTLLNANTSRAGAIIFNDSTSVMYVKFGATASTTSYTTQIGAKGYYEIPYTYTGRVDAIWASAVGAARITELT